MQKWEYLVVYVHGSEIAQEKPEVDIFMDADKYTEKLNTYGQAGWELVSMDWDRNGAKASFKRPLRTS